MGRRVFVVFLAFIALAIFTLYHSSSSSLSPSDLLNLERAENVAVQGKVEVIERNETQTIFYISDGVNKVKAIYKGEVTSSEIIAVGDWKDGFFYVRELLSKCHTEYGG
ncbi:MAG: cytochrome c maturation protein CcmE [Archaeoglobaceae archaeon]